MTAPAIIALAALLLLATAVATLRWQCRRHERTLDSLWTELAQPPGEPAATFDPDTLADLPAPARRWLSHAIAPGTALAHTALLRMHGSIVLDERKPPWPFTADQVLAPPRGFVWRARVGSGMMRIRGFDRYAHGRGELRWWLLGLVPVVTSRGPDVDRSAAGRLAGEACLIPAALLPGRGARWEPVDSQRASASLTVAGETITVTVRVDDEGGLQRVVFHRWNGDPRNGPVGFLPFIVDFEGERTFDGYTIPAGLAAGWGAPGGEDPKYFFRAELDNVSFG